MKLDPSQQVAVDLISRERICVVTGGPGTGKTTSLRAALAQCRGTVFYLASPTGKAAKRMSEATGEDATTIHRLLGYGPLGGGRMGFRMNSTSPIRNALIIIDEASMIDVELGASLLAAIGPDARIAFVGDVNQLPSVGPGKFLSDIIASGAVPVAQLQTIHRSAEQSWMVAQGPTMLAGKMPPLESTASFEFFECEGGDVVAQRVLDVAERLEKEGTEAQILTPQKTTSCGVDALNLRLQRLLNPENKGFEWKARGGTFREGDRVLQTANDYQLDVYNGETGVVVGMKTLTVSGRSHPMLLVDFGRPEPTEYSRDAARALRLSYAMSVHKSQGSEWDTVIVVCHSMHTHMLSRQLLYTAVTRAKRKVVLIGNEKGLKAALKNTRPSMRNTELAELIREGMETAA